MTRAGEAADGLLNEGLQRAKRAKDAFRDELLQANPDLRVPPTMPPGLAPTFKAAQSLPSTIVPSSMPSDARLSRVRNAECDVSFEPRSGITRMVGRIELQASLRMMALMLDPRSWSCTGGVIEFAYIVDEDATGEYKPSPRLNDVRLGRPWKNGLLYEYARSEVASFENVLLIGEFSVDPIFIRATYSLHDCLVCTFGGFSAPGGLTVNEGYVQATLLDRHWWKVEVLKKVRVRDLTPNDPGNKYDFGKWVNSTMGAALSEWVRDTSIMSPVL